MSDVVLHVQTILSLTFFAHFTWEISVCSVWVRALFNKVGAQVEKGDATHFQAPVRMQQHLNPKLRTVAG